MDNWQENSTIAIWLAVGLVVFLLFIGALLFFARIYIKREVKDAKAMVQVKLQHQKQLLSNSMEIQEKERARIALDMHDGLLFDLNVLSLLIATPNKNEEARQLLKNCSTTARRISHDLTPPLIESCQLNEIFEGILHQVELHTTDLFQSGLTDLELDVPFKLNVTRILQEILNNTIKHAKANNIWLKVRTTKKYLAISYKDDGIGFVKKEHLGGLGQGNIAMRVDLLNGKYKLRTKPKQGVQYTFCIPINERNG